MKNFISATGFFLLMMAEAKSQNVIIKGKIKCQSPSPGSTKGAENIVVVPTFVPSQSTLTVTRPAGYFEFNTGMPLGKLDDKQVQVHLVYRCGNTCDNTVIRAFVSEDQDRQNRDASKCYVTLRDWHINSKCAEVELPSHMADSMLKVILKQPVQPIGDISNISSLAGSPALLNLLTTLTTLGSFPGNFIGTFEVVNLKSGNIRYGQFLLASPLFHSANTGFNFAPVRDFSEAVFWNPSTIAMSKKNNNISLLTNFKNNGKRCGFTRLSNKISLGAGFIYTRQDEFRPADYETAGGSPAAIDSVALKLYEYSAHVSGAYEVREQLAVGLSIKSVWQEFTIPTRLIVNNDKLGTFFDSTITKQQFDIDISATYKFSKSLQAGISLMNLTGSELYADSFVPKEQNILFTNQRSAGLGLVYKYHRFNAGLDVLITEDGLYDATFGVNYVPFNHALISAGIAFKQLSYSFSFRLKHFRIAFINDNGYLINEKRKGKSSFLDGRIYGGFTFNF